MGAAGGGAPALRVFNADHATGVTVNTGAWQYNRPCAQQYVGKYQSRMAIRGRLIPDAPVQAV
eukprot:COSAG05_NODE_10086_length_583_cov_8.665289_1_plen_63_part_00